MFLVQFFYLFTAVCLPQCTNTTNVNYPSTHQDSFGDDMNETMLKPMNDEHRLLKNLLRDYDKAVRPVVRATQKTVVLVGLTLTNIFKIDEKNQVLSLNVWLQQDWIDERLHWVEQEYGNLSEITVPTYLVWTPDIVLYNNARDYHEVLQTNIALYSTGQMAWAPPVKLRSLCALDVTYFPFDDQTCELRFGSWIYGSNQIDVMNRSSDWENDTYHPNGEWSILSTEVFRRERFYTCCPDEPFPEIVFRISLRRRVLFYTYNIIIPCVMLSMLTLVLFWLPSETGEKITLGLTVLLAYSVFSFNIGESMPETSNVIPLIAIYIMCVMGLSAVSVVLSVVVLNLHHTGSRADRQIPYWLQFVAYRILAPLVCFDLSDGPSSTKPIASAHFAATLVHFVQLIGKCVTACTCCSGSGAIQTSASNRRLISEELALSETSESFTSKLHRRSVGVVDLSEHCDNDSSQLERAARTLKLVNLLSRAGVLMDSFEQEKRHYTTASEWQIIARILDKFFFMIVLFLVTSLTFVLLIVIPLVRRS